MLTRYISMHISYTTTFDIKTHKFNEHREETVHVGVLPWLYIGGSRQAGSVLQAQPEASVLVRDLG